jgi:hypothetical protein
MEIIYDIGPSSLFHKTEVKGKLDNLMIFLLFILLLWNGIAYKILLVNLLQIAS